MKTVIKIFISFIVINSVMWMTQKKVSAQVSVSFQVFYDDLSPYGNWIDNSDYGYVWVPNVDPGFTPYGTNGYWLLTDAGWTWVSNYPWGWAPFHYGRWYYDPFYGPMWVPGNEWGPGWVTWRMSDGYYGWAPIGPGISIDIAYSNGYNLPSNQWIFVRDRDFGSTNINNYYINSSNNITIINNSTVINNIHTNNSGNSSNIKYNTGPDRTEVEKHVGKTINPIALSESNKPGQNLSKNQLQIYRPQVKNNDNENKPVPSKITNLKDVKKPSERNISNQPNNIKPQKNNNTQPLNQQNIKPTNNNGNQQQPNNIEPQKNNNTQPLKQQNVNPSKNNEKKQQPNTVNPNNNTQPLKQQNVNPSNNNGNQQKPTQKQNTGQSNKQQQPQQSNPPKNTGVKKPSR